MLRMRIPAGELTATQMDGLADVAGDWGGGLPGLHHARQPANPPDCPAQPRQGPPALAGTRPHRQRLRGGQRAQHHRHAHGGHRPGRTHRPPGRSPRRCNHYILNNRDLYGLPRKFNISFDGGGAIDTAADTNDVGFIAVTVGEAAARTAGVEPGVYFRLELCGITGHQQFARDVGVLVRPGAKP